MTARVRFAPSPTGYLHIGGVRTALFNWLWAKKTGGTFVLRIEDTDQERSTPESRQVIFDSLRWLGLSWDEGPDVGGPHTPYTQMERLALYKQYSDQLVAMQKAFRCACTKEELDAQREALKAADPKAQFKYPGTCRDKNVSANERHVVRFKAPRTGEVVYVDKVFGEVRTPNVENQDFVLMRADGIPLYNFGAVVDDITMGITLVARGRDHMINTPPQILLYEALGAAVPEFAHLPMMLNQKGAKLSKRDGVVGVFEYRDAGYTPAGVLNYLARFGWGHGDQEIFSLEQLIEAFSWDGCSRSDGKFDPKKFIAIQHEHLKTPELTSDAIYIDSLKPFVEARGITFDAVQAQRALYLVRDRGQTLIESAEKIDCFLRDAPVYDDVAVAKALTEDARACIAELHADLTNAAWELTELHAAFDASLARQGITVKELGQAARVALTGKAASPGLLHDVMFVLGRERTLARLQHLPALDAASAQAAP